MSGIIKGTVDKIVEALTVGAGDDGKTLTPREIVSRLDSHIVGQSAAKRAVAIAMRNRWRWLQLDEAMRREVTPRNILMIGPTGVGKTEITRRLATLTGAPFIKVEATKYTEVGYYGRDVESMVRDLVESAISLVRTGRQEEVRGKAEASAEERLLDLLIPHSDYAQEAAASAEATADSEPAASAEGAAESESQAEAESEEGTRMSPAEKRAHTREVFRGMLRAGKLEDRDVELSIEERTSPVQVFTNMGMDQMDMDIRNMLDRVMPSKNKDRRMTVAEARRVLQEQETEKLLDKEAIHEEAIRLAEETGMIFIDEIDKVCSSSEGNRSADVSRQGVQRDLLPIVEGTTVQTRYGSVSTEKMMFIAAGAFHRARPSDLMPELQGRFPIRVELDDLNREDFTRILTEPQASLTRQYQELLAVDGIELAFTQDGIDALADVAFHVNQTTQNIGARRLQTIMERLLEDVSFEAPDCGPQTITVDALFVRERLDDIRKNEDLSNFVL